MSVALLQKQDRSASHARATDLIRSSLTDPDSVVRSHAVREIGCLDERQEFVPILEKIAKTDPEKHSGKALDGRDGDEFYPVRYDARRVLRDIKITQVVVASNMLTRLAASPYAHGASGTEP